MKASGKALLGIFLAAALLTGLRSIAEEADLWLCAKGENGLCGYIDMHGSWMIEPRYAAADPYFTRELASVRHAGEDGSAGGQDIIDRQGRSVVPDGYVLQPMQYIGSGQGTEKRLMALCSEEWWFPCGLIDPETGLIWADERYQISPFYTDSTLVPVMFDGLIGYINRHSGEIFFPGRYLPVDPFQFFDGVTAAAPADEKEENLHMVLLDEKGDAFSLPEGYDFVRGSHAACGRIPVVNQAGMAGYADLKGRVVIPPVFRFANNFAENRAVVQISEEKLAVIDQEGNILLSGLSEADDAYRNGILFAKKEGETCCFDTDGSAMPNIRPYSLTDGSGLFWMPASGKGVGNPDRWTWWLAGRSGEILFGPCYLTHQAIEESLFYVDGLEPVGDLQGKWGYIDRQGETVIDFVFDSAEPFRHGFARVGQDGKSKWIDPSGALIWEEQ